MATRRLEIGLDGGSVLRLTVDESLVGDVPGNVLAGGERWLSIAADEGTFWVARDQVRYVRVPAGQVPGRVGFSGS
jgi:hypothetical protein